MFVAHPIAFDYAFIQWYLYEFVGYNPFFNAGLDITSYAMAMMKTPFSRSHKPFMPKEWTNTGYEHSHVPLDDALGHAMTFCNLVAANNL